MKSENRLGGPAIYPDAWKNGLCKRYNEAKMIRKAWGFSHIYNNVPHYLRAEARQKVSNYFSNGSTDGLAFDHYETDWGFD
jgi:hypothetical protein